MAKCRNAIEEEREGEEEGEGEKRERERVLVWSKAELSCCNLCTHLKTWRCREPSLAHNSSVSSFLFFSTSSHLLLLLLAQTLVPMAPRKRLHNEPTKDSEWRPAKEMSHKEAAVDLA